MIEIKPGRYRHFKGNEYEVIGIAKLGSDRMGESKGKEATVEEALSQIERLSEETGLTKATVDNIIWSFCADGYGEVCTATPHCEVCPVKTWCKCK